MAGYYRYSMSNNAVSAYEAGEKPVSRWTKAAILEDLPDEIAEKFQCVPLHELKEALLVKSSWHHTSSKYNKTDFYAVDIDRAESMTEEDILALSQKKDGEKSSQIRTVSYLVWSGSRRHPKAARHECKCTVSGKWAITPHGKKLITGNGFEFID